MSRLSRTALVLLIFALLLSGTSVLPVGISYVVSDSMAPTINDGDGFVRVPAGDVEPGEIVVFETPEQDRRYAVHRVVRETPRGFVTKGDNNEATDQAAGHPYVQREDIHGEVLTVAGGPVVIPNLGVVAQFINTNRMLLLAILGGLLFFDLVTRSGSRPSRPNRAGDFLNGITAISAIIVVVLLLAGGTTAQITFVAVDGGANASKTVPVGEATTKQVEISGLSRTPYTHYAVNWKGATVVNRSWNGSALRLTVRIPPIETEGQYATVATTHRYPQTLPPALIDRLYTYHPVVPAVATVIPVIAPLYVLGVLVVDRDARLREGRRGWRTLRRRLEKLGR